MERLKDVRCIGGRGTHHCRVGGSGSRDRAKQHTAVGSISQVSRGAIMMNRAVRSLCAVAAMLAANEVCGFVAPAGVSSLAGRTPVARVATSPSRSSRRWEKQQQMDAGNVDASGAGDKVRARHILARFWVGAVCSEQ